MFETMIPFNDMFETMKHETAILSILRQEDSCKLFLTSLKHYLAGDGHCKTSIYDNNF